MFKHSFHQGPNSNEINDNGDNGVPLHVWNLIPQDILLETIYFKEIHLIIMKKLSNNYH